MSRLVLLAYLAIVLLPAQLLPELDRYGGFAAQSRHATGFFRLEEIAGRWFFITPDGHPYIALGANHTGKFLQDPAQPTPLIARAGGLDKARAQMLESYRKSGMTAGEAYAPLDPLLRRELPYVVNIDFPGPSKFAFDVFDPDFQARLRASVLEQLKPVRDDPMALGIAFADLPVWTARRLAYFRELPVSAPGNRRYREFVQTGGSDDAFLGLVADTLYRQLRALVREGAPHHLFFGERFVLRQVPDPVLRAVGKHVDVFCTQALILSPQRPPEWQLFQQEGFDRDHALVGKPIIVIDWAAPFSLDTGFETDRGTVKPEAEATAEAAKWLASAFELPYLIGVFKCQWIGRHGNDRWFPEGRMKRTYLRDDGTAFTHRTEGTRRAHHDILRRLAARLKR